jgi:hypothetical protein
MVFGRISSQFFKQKRIAGLQARGRRQKNPRRSGASADKSFPASMPPRGGERGSSARPATNSTARTAMPRFVRFGLPAIGSQAQESPPRFPLGTTV